MERLTALRFVTPLVAAFALGSAAPAYAERCRPLFERAFATLATRDFRVIERETNPADVQLKIDTEIYAIFGARRQACEEGSYSLFLEQFQNYTTSALRGPKDEKSIKLRAAIAVIRQSPESIESTQGANEAAQFRQTAWNIRAVAQETGMTPVVRQMLEAVESVGPPAVVRRAEPVAPVVVPDDVFIPTPAPTPAPSRPTAPAAPGNDSRVEKVYVPTEPLPGWAVVSLYEIEENARQNNPAAILPKVQAILRWMKSVTPSTTPN